MAAGDPGSRTLEQTPTWAVAVVCFGMVAVSIVIEYVLELVGEWLIKKHRRGLYESLLKIKAELMLLGFISLLLTVGQGPISEICIPQSVADTWHPCKLELAGASKAGKAAELVHGGRRLLSNSSDSLTSVRRSLAGGYGDKCSPKGKVPLVSVSGIHQLHIFIFVLACSHVIYCILTMALGRLKMRKWNSWEKETKSAEYQFSHDPERFRYARDTTFGRRHLSVWSRSRLLLWTVCFFRQFVRSVPKVDYLTLRHGFIMAHLAPQSSLKFDFQKYIQRSLEKDFKVVVGISPVLWFFSLLFLLASTNGWYSYLWLPFIPLIIVLVVGTKLQLIITRMGLHIQDRGDVVQGVPIVQPADNLFWFNRPRLILYLIHFVLFQNAFQLAFFAWTTYEFGLNSCYHQKTEDVVIRITMGVFVQFLCSYVTLPLYALVTQMGSSMKPTIFNETVAKALKNWHHTARKHVKQNKKLGLTPASSMPTTPSHGMSPIHLLRNNYLSSHEAESPGLSPSRFANEGNDQWSSEGSPSPMHHKADGGSSHQFRNHDQIGDHQEIENQDIPAAVTEPTAPPASRNRRASSDQHEIRIGISSTDFSFDKRSQL